MHAFRLYMYFFCYLFVLAGIVTLGKALTTYEKPIELTKDIEVHLAWTCTLSQLDH